MSDTKNLLVELFVEELPPKALKKLGDAFGAALLPAAWAQPEQRIEITGSAIKRVNAETAAPVTVINREQIERTGAASVAR